MTNEEGKPSNRPESMRSRAEPDQTIRIGIMEDDGVAYALVASECAKRVAYSEGIRDGIMIMVRTLLVLAIFLYIADRVYGGAE